VSRFFPSYVQIEQNRFLDDEVLEEELVNASFTRFSCVRLDLPRTFSREMALRKLREHSTSTLALLNEDEFREGVARAERELPDPVEYTLKLLFVRADRN
jgi:hypothetical protein